MARRAHILVITIVVITVTALLGACSYTPGESLSPPRTLGPPPTRPVVAPFTTPATTTPATTTTTPATTTTTVVATTVVPTTAPAPASAAPTVQTASPVTTTPPASSSARSGTVSVQAGAFFSLESAELAVRQLADQGFPGFRALGSEVVRVLRVNLAPTDAETLVQQLAAAGIPALVTTRTS